MPTYEYACKDCSNHFEIVQSFSDDNLTECPSCQGNLRKVFSAAGIIFKGSGWHIKDYADSSGKAANGTSSGTESGDGSDSGSDSSDTSDNSSSGSSDSGSTVSASSDNGSSTTSSKKSSESTSAA